MIYLLLASIFTLSAFAAPLHTKVQAGDKAPYSGRLLNPEADKKVRDKYSVLEQTVEVQQQRLELKDLAIGAKVKESDLWKAEASKQAKVVEMQRNDMRNGILMGIGGTLLGLFLFNKASK